MILCLYTYLEWSDVAGVTQYKAKAKTSVQDQDQGQRLRRQGHGQGQNNIFTSRVYATVTSSINSFKVNKKIQDFLTPR